MTRRKRLPAAISRRDYFAGHALAGLCANPNNIDVMWDSLAEESWGIADEMIAATDKPNPPEVNSKAEKTP